MLNNMEAQTSVPKVYVVLGVSALYFLSIFFNIGGEFLTNLAGFMIPGYYSLEALFTSGKADDTHVSACKSPSLETSTNAFHAVADSTFPNPYRSNELIF